MFLSDIDWGAISNFAVKGIEAGVQIQGQRLAQKSQLAQAQMSLEQARLDQQAQYTMLARQQMPGRYSGDPGTSTYRGGTPISPLFLMGAAAAILFPVLLMLRR